MALIKSQSTEFAIDADYWNIRHIAIHHDIDTQTTITVTAAGYKDKTARQANGIPLEYRTVNITLPARRDISLSDIYTHIKTLSEWSGAVDD